METITIITEMIEIVIGETEIIEEDIETIEETEEEVDIIEMIETLWALLSMILGVKGQTILKIGDNKIKEKIIFNQKINFNINKNQEAEQTLKHVIVQIKLLNMKN